MTSIDRNEAEPRRGTVRVLESVAAPGAVTKYIDQVVAGRDEDVRFLYFSWRTTLLGRFDVFHVHWPEFLVRGGSAPIKLVRRVLFRVMLYRIKRQKIPVIRTMHNLAPHTPGDRREPELLEKLDRLTTAWVRINDVTHFPPGGIHRTILHGDYRQRFQGVPKSDPIPGRLVYAGRIEPYKGVDTLLEVFSDVQTDGAQLRIIGKPTDELADVVKNAERRDRRVTSILEFVSDEVLVQEVTLATLVVLPYSEMHNSGILLVALSLNRPVLVPWSDANDRIASEVGPEWVKMYHGNLTRSTLEEALQTTGNLLGTPDLSGRSWDIVGAAYARVFREALERPDS